MRVIAGRWRGRRVAAARGRATRPTSDRVREAVFSILGDTVCGARVLDLFAGSGTLGLEALSRGAAEATFVDCAPAAARVIRENLAALGGEAKVIRGDALAALRDAARAGRLYDLVFLDPPYREAAALAPALGASLAGVLAPGARIVAESDRREPVELGFDIITRRNYGDTLIAIFSSP